MKRTSTKDASSNRNFKSSQVQKRHSRTILEIPGTPYENVGSTSDSDSDDSRDEIRKQLLNLEDKLKEQKTKKPKAEFHRVKMNKWYLKEFEEQLGLEIGGSDDSGDAYDSKSEKTISSDSDKISDSDDSNSDDSGWLESIKNVSLCSLDKRTEDCKPKPEEQSFSMPVFRGPMPSMPIYDEKTSDFEIVQTPKQPEIIQEDIEMIKPNELDETPSNLDNINLSPIEDVEFFSDSDSSSEFGLSLSFMENDPEVEDTLEQLDDPPQSKLTYWEEMSALPVDTGEISQEELIAILKEEENEKNAEKSQNSTEHRSDSELEEVTRDQTKLHDGLDFYEDSAQLLEGRDNFSSVVIKEDSVFVDYQEAIKKLEILVQSAPSHLKYEIYLLIYPLMVLTYLQMVASDKVQKARAFILSYQDEFDDSYAPRLVKLKDISRPEEVPNKARKLLAGLQKIKMEMSESAYRQLLFDTEEWPRGQQEKLLVHFHIQSYNDEQKPQQRFEIGKPLLEPIFYGAPEPLHKKDFTPRPFLQKRRRKKNEPQTHKNLHLPPGDKMYSPNIKRMDLLHRKNDEQYRVRLDRDNLPSAYLYTVPPCDEVVICAHFSDNISMLALGTVASAIHVFSLKPSKLVKLKPASWLKVLDTGMAGVDKGMLDPNSKCTKRTLYGHQGPVYGCSFNPDDRFLLSCSEDFTVRLWCLLSWSCVVIYPGHLAPVCHVVFAPMGYYFATASGDCTARVWMQDNRKPARILIGHLDELAVCIFHPNRHYLATGSADSTVRIWDVIKASQVRLFRGHRARITALTYSICGRYLVSGGDDKLIMVWDTANETLIRFLEHHKSSINTMEIGLDNNILVVGGQDCQMTYWDFERLVKEYLNGTRSSRKQNQAEKQDSNVEEFLLKSFPSQDAPFYMVHFSRRNLLLGFCATPQALKNNILDKDLKQQQEEKKVKFDNWLHFLDTVKLKACFHLKDKFNLSTKKVQKKWMLKRITK
ncbi:transcription initiation factor TFIID subunit 5 [Drosophila subpulchrella]|uniref:transcription initiation factor TFIID subunit 5 n=1 Tax=Drosophila subpulchrella TaxID=1486046 RepID=UPI0018A15CDA|nr:transcription initiation factor TFIID subunit 5 [Drosophila subpulchrella]